MSVANFKDIANYSARPLPLGYPLDSHITLYQPGDNLTGALGYFIDCAEYSLVLALPGFSDDTIATAVLRKLQDPEVYVQLVLPDAGGKRGDALRATVNYPSNSVAFSAAEPVMMGSVDGLQSFMGITGSIVTFVQEPMIAFRTRHRIDLLSEAARTLDGQ